MESDPDWEHRLRELRRVVPIARTQSIGGVIITLFSLDDYAEGFAVRVRILLEEWHPVAEEARAREAAIQRTWEEARQREQETEVEEAQERAFLSGDHESLLYPEFELLAFDEGGRQYDPGFGGGNQWSSLLEGWLDAQFNPALDPTVRRLRLVVPEVRWRRNWGKHRDEGERTDEGPWTFEVVLPERE
jgi:hypothetical protein